MTEKKYTIHILAVKAVDHETFDLPPEQNAVIVCTEHDNPYIRGCLPENVLVIDFPDVRGERYPGAFGREHARKIVHFLCGLSDCVTDVYVCCEKGESRSPAVAAALLMASGRSDAAVWNNPYYAPNPLVYRHLCREYGLRVTLLSVWVRSVKNRRAFRMVKKGKRTTYERWQILE